MAHVCYIVRGESKKDYMTGLKQAKNMKKDLHWTKYRENGACSCWYFAFDQIIVELCQNLAICSVNTKQNFDR